MKKNLIILSMLVLGVFMFSTVSAGLFDFTGNAIAKFDDSADIELKEGALIQIELDGEEVELLAVVIDGDSATINVDGNIIEMSKRTSKRVGKYTVKLVSTESSFWRRDTSKIEIRNFQEFPEEEDGEDDGGDGGSEEDEEISNFVICNDGCTLNEEDSWGIYEGVDGDYNIDLESITLNSVVLSVTNPNGGSETKDVTVGATKRIGNLAVRAYAIGEEDGLINVFLLITYEYAGFNDMTYEGVLNMIGDGDVFREVSPEIGANCEDICSYQGGSLYSCLFGMKEGNIGGASYSSLTTCNSYITTEEIPMALSCMCARSP